MDDSSRALVSPLFHDGEVLAQQRMGVHAEVSAFAAQAIRRFMPEQHRQFFEGLPFIVLAARDDKQRPWASILCGAPGFIQSPDDKTLAIDARLVAEDALSNALYTDASIGLLGIMLAERRRNRMNGHVSALNSASLVVRVDQSFGNCPQHISARQWVAAPANEAPLPAQTGKQLNPEMQRLVEQTDTFFIASGRQGRASDPSIGMDASHRGGPAGFVHIVSPSQLLFPDYAGNKLFNTIGNLLCEPAIGLLFIDFASGSILQVTGQATIDWDSPELNQYPGAQHLICIAIEEVVFLKQALPIRWSDPKFASRELTLESKQAESVHVTSFYFSARDNGPLPPFTAGQHLPIELNPDSGPSLARSYSMSGRPTAKTYRISVKRHAKGAASHFLHDEIKPGDTILAGPPAGNFVLTDHNRPIVLISAGVGVTPMISLLYALAGSDRPVTFIQGARNSDEHLFANEVAALANQIRRFSCKTAYSQPLAQDIGGRHFDHHGRIDRQFLASTLATTELTGDFYLCGPPVMLADLSTWLSEQGILDGQIHIESF